MSETELRKLRERLSSRKHFEDAWRASRSKYETELLGWHYAAYMSILYDVHHVGVFGVRRGGEHVDTGHPESRPPKDLTNLRSPAVRAMDLYRDEKKWMNGSLAPFLEARTNRMQSRLDDIVGEATS